MNEHILLAYEFDGNGKGEAISDDLISKKVQSDRLTWIHLDASHPDSKTWLEKELNYLDPFVIEALLADETRPRMTQIDNGILLILRGVNLNENSDPEDMVSIRLWVDEHRIVSMRKRKLKAVLDIEEKLKIGKGPKDSGEFLCMLTSRLFERMEPVLTTLDETTDNIEEKILEKADISLRESIVDVRRQAIIFRRYMAPQRDAISQLRMTDITWFNDLHKRHLQEAYNHVTRYVEDLDAIRERSQIIKDELANVLADKLNRNMYVLSVIAAIFLPLGFLTGLLGVNLGGIPGTDNIEAFSIFSISLVVIVLIQIVIFKKYKWF